MALETIVYEGREVFSPKYDLMFKGIFAGKDSSMLASFLSGILKTEIARDGLTVRNGEMLKKRKNGKLVFLDIYVTLSDGSHVNVEMQVSDEKNMGRRSLYHLSQLMSEQLDSGGKYKRINPAIAVNILDFDYIDNAGAGKYHSVFRMKNVENNAEMPCADAFEIHYIELKKAALYAKDSMTDLWLKFLSAKTEEEWKMLMRKSPLIKKAVGKAVRLSADKDIRFALIAEKKFQLDWNSSIGDARDEGEAKGLVKGEAIGEAKGLVKGEAIGEAKGLVKGEAIGEAKGLAIGRAQGILQMAKAMKNEGIDYSVIAKYANMTLDQINSL